MLKALHKGKKEVDVNPKDAKTIVALIRSAIKLTVQAVALKSKILSINQKMLPWAEKLCAETGLKSATFRSDAGTAVVIFTESVAYDAKDMPQIKAVLGPLFSRYFHEIPSFAINPESIPDLKKLLGPAFDTLIVRQSYYKHTPELKGLLCDGDSQVGKKLRPYIRIEPGKPSFGYEEPVRGQAEGRSQKPEVKSKKEKAA